MKKYVILFLVIIVGMIGAFLILDKEETPKKEKKVEVKKSETKTSKLSLVMVGDALLHSSLYKDGYKNGVYDFSSQLEYIKPIIQNYDLAFYNQESILGGTELGLSDYPTFNSPQEFGNSMIDAGFNLVSLANNHTLDRGEKAVLNSCEYWKDKDVLTAGSYCSNEEANEIKIKEKNGIKYTLLAYTYGTNGIKVPEGKEYLVNIYSDEKVKNDIEKVRDKVDLLMVSMHWGTEYSTSVSATQEEIANYLSSLGVDIIIGSHPHVVEPIAFIGKTMVIYSLGNFISDQEGVERLTGLMASIDIHKTVENGVSTIELRNPKAELLYTHSTYGKKRNFVVYPYTSLNDEILPGYRDYYETYKNIVLSLDSSIEMPSLE